jgi:hypothetical protein
MRSGRSFANHREPACELRREAPQSESSNAFALVWVLLKQIWALCCRGDFRGLDSLVDDAEAKMVAALRAMMAEDLRFAHVADIDFRLEFNGRDYDFVPTGGWSRPPTCSSTMKARRFRSRTKSWQQNCPRARLTWVK